MSPSRHSRTTAERLVDDYLRRLRAAAADLPAERREELVEEIAEHVAAGRANGSGDDERRVREVLERLGAPETVAAAAREGAPLAARPRLGAELVAVLLLTVGSVLLPVLGWLVGVTLLWASSRWTSREKLLGTLVLPGGLLPAAALLTVPTSSCSGVSSTGPDGRTVVSSGCDSWLPPVPLGLGALLVMVVAPLVVAAVLWRRAGERAAGQDPVPYGRAARDLPHRVAVPVLGVLVALSVAVPLRVVTGGGSTGPTVIAPPVPSPSPR